MNSFVLRIKTKSGQQIISDLLATDTVKNLKMKLTELTGIESGALHVLSGFPPKVLNLSNDASILKDAGIMSGDMLIVEEKRISSELFNDDRRSPSNIFNNEDSHGCGTLMKKVVPADNSCLFTSIGFVISGKINADCSSFMREIIASSVAADPEEYSEAFLSKPNKEYCEWILKPDSWGGGIELSILSKFYGLEIVVVNSVNGNINRFGEDQHYAQRVFLMFDGIHYDPLYMELPNSGPGQTIFSTDDDEILLKAAELAREAFSSHQYTDVQKFTLKCMECNIYFRGSSAASQHAKETGHMNFGEIIS